MIACTWRRMRTLIFVRNPLPQNPHLFNLRFIATAAKNQNQEHSFTVSYLVNSCGLSPESAVSASKIVHLKSSENPDSVINFLEIHGFSRSQISYMIRGLPRLLVASPENTLLPKLKFLRSKGASSTDVARILSGYPWILTRSLDKHIIPTFDLYSNLLQSDVRALAAIRRHPRILNQTSTFSLMPNLQLLRDNKVSAVAIAYVFSYKPRLMACTNPRRFKEFVERTIGFGFNPSTCTFAIGLLAISSLSKLTWERKVHQFIRWGWSEETILDTFQRYPWCMLYSEDKVIGAMDYYVNKFGVEPSYVSRRPQLLSYNLENRVIPRCTAIRILESKGIIKRYNTLEFIILTQRLFMQKFVTPYLREAPELLELFPEKD